MFDGVIIIPIDHVLVHVKSQRTFYFERT